MATNKKQSTIEENTGKRIHHGKNIRVFMVMRDWTIDQLAEKVGLASRTVSNYLGTEKLSDDILEKFASALEGIHVFWLKSSVNEKLERFAGINCEKFLNFEEGDNVEGNTNVYTTPIKPVERIYNTQIKKLEREKDEIKSELKQEVQELKQENALLRKELAEKDQKVIEMLEKKVSEMENTK